MPILVKVDRRGRVVIPARERERLAVTAGGSLELIATAEGLFLELRGLARVRLGDDGLPVIAIEDEGPVSNQDSLGAIHRERERS